MWCWTVLSVLLLVMGQGSCSLTVREYDILAYRTIHSVVPLATYQATSLVNCASFCRASDGCVSFTIDLDALSSAESVTCNTLGSHVTAAGDLVSSSLHYAQDRGLGVDLSSSGSVTPAATVPTTTVSTTTTVPTSLWPTTSTSTPSSTQIIDIVYGVVNACDHSSQQDFMVITTDYVYFYDTIADMSNPSCYSDDYDSVFPGYSDLPPIDEVAGVLMQQSTVELYSKSKVFRWQIQSDGSLIKAGYTTTTIAAHLHADLPNTFSAQGTDIVWAVRRARSSVERHFYFGGANFVLYSEQWGIYSYTQADVVNDGNGFNMNPWSDIPTNTLAITGYTVQPDTNFALITADGNVYAYTLDHGANNNNPSKTLTDFGFISLS